MSNPFVAFKNNWKKAVFALSLCNYGLYKVYDYCNVSGAMRANCFIAKEYGDQKLEPNRQPRHITVILNPVAGKRKTKKMYEKFVEPLLHLAGIKVSLVETEYPGQVESLMSIMSNCDGVAIVGGDGTVHEAVNGLLKRPDRVHAVKMFPLAIIPTGRNNNIAAFTHRNMDPPNYKEFIMGSTMSLIKATQLPVDVVEMTRIEKNDEEKNLEYFIYDIRNGIYQDVVRRWSGRFFYQNHLRPHFVRLVRYLQPDKYPLPCIESIQYTKPCEGCIKCYAQHKITNDPPINSGTSDWQNAPGSKQHGGLWSSLLSLMPVAKSVKIVNEEEEREKKYESECNKRESPNCGVWHEMKLHETNTSDVRVFNTDNTRLGIQLYRNRKSEPNDKYEALDVKLIVDGTKIPQISLESDELEEHKNDENKDLKQKNPEKTREQKELDETKVKFFLDTQPHRAYSVELKPKRDAIRVFTYVV